MSKSWCQSKVQTAVQNIRLYLQCTTRQIQQCDNVFCLHGKACRKPHDVYGTNQSGEWTTLNLRSCTDLESSVLKIFFHRNTRKWTSESTATCPLQQRPISSWLNKSLYRIVIQPFFNESTPLHKLTYMLLLLVLRGYNIPSVSLCKRM